MERKKISLLIKHTGMTLLSLLLFGTAGMLFLLVISFVPQKTIYEHAKESVDRLSWECTDHEMFYNKIKGGAIDYFTDFLILNTCYYSAGNIKDTLLGGRFAEGSEEYINPIYQYFDGNTDSLSSVYYERYWHGYLIFLRPALLFANLKQIRIICFFVNIVLTVLVVVLLIKRKEEKSNSLIVPFIAFVISLSPIAVAFSLQYYSVFYSTVLAVFLILIQKEKTVSKYWYIFLFTGMCVGFFDLLTYPLVSLGVPLIMVFALYCDENNKLIKQIVNCILYSFSWGIGYAGILLFRWISASFISGRNIVLDAFDRFLYRSSHEYSGVDYTIINTLKVNINEQCNLLTICAVLVSVLLFFILLPRFHSKANYVTVITVMFISLYPIIWYYVLMQHSNMHFWMTYRNLSVLIFAFLTMMYMNLNFKRI